MGSSRQPARRVAEDRHPADGHDRIRVGGARVNNLKDVHGSVSGRDGVVSIDQAPIRGSRRSSPATYTGLLDAIRTAFAKANGVKPALFSANSEGACPACNGAGVILTDLGMMAGVTSVCEECQGRRFQASVLEYKLGGRNIAEAAARAGDAHGRGRRRLRARRADERVTPCRSRAAARTARSPRRLRQVGHRDRAPPERDGAR